MTNCAIFGGSRGIGASIAHAFVKDGFDVVFLSRNIPQIETFLNDNSNIRKVSPSQKLLTVQCDVREEQSVQLAISEVEAQLGGIDVLVNAAGVNKDALLVRSSYGDMVQQVHTNLLGPMLTCRAALRGMMQRKHGCVINIGSVVGAMGNPGQCVYSASKSGLVGFTKSLAKEVASRGIRANVIAPGYIETYMTAGMKRAELEGAIPMGRFGQPSEVAHVARFLVDATYITGQVLYVDGGLHTCS